MHSAFIVAALAALPLAFAAPSRLPAQYSRRQAESAVANNTSSIAKCDLSKVVQPQSILAPPTGLNLVLVAHGQGTQNYTCGANLTAAPTSIGAVAQLWDASCELAGTPSEAADSFGSIAETSTIGMHFFVDNTTPDFNIAGLGNTETKKVEECNAPDPADNVKWLRLVAQAAGTTSSVKQVYRLNTAGGIQPKSCEGKAAGDVMTVPYEAQYWIYEVPSSSPSTSTPPQPNTQPGAPSPPQPADIQQPSQPSSPGSQPQQPGQPRLPNQTDLQPPTPTAPSSTSTSPATQPQPQTKQPTQPAPEQFLGAGARSVGVSGEGLMMCVLSVVGVVVGMVMV